MRDETRKNLIDILQAAAEIQDFVGGMDFKDYQNNAVTRREAIVWQAAKKHLPILVGEIEDILNG